MYICLAFLGYNGTKLEKCVNTVVIGFQSIDDTIASTQFIFKEEESKLNLFVGSHAELCEYILSHFCPPGGTVLDMSCDPSGLCMYVTVTLRFCCHIIIVRMYYTHSK